MNQSQRLAEMYGELAAVFVWRHDADNSALLARRAAHHALIYLASPEALRRIRVSFPPLRALLRGFYNGNQN